MRSLRPAARCAPAALAAALLLGAAPALARPFTLDDLLSLERLDRMEITPDGRRLVIQTEAAYDTAPRFDADGDTTPLLGRVKVADLARPTAARDLVAPEPGAGYVAGPISPSGRAMVVQRLKDGAWDTGVVELATGQVRWLGLSTEAGLYGRSLQWRSETRLVAIALAPGDLPLHMRTIHQTTERLAGLWRTAAAGRAPTASVVGSGRDLALWPAPPARRLVEIDLETHAIRTLASGGFFDLEVSADGRVLAALADAEPLPPTPQEPVRVASPGRRRSLTLVDLATGAISQPLPDHDLLPQLLAWSPTARRLLVYGRPLGGRPWSEGELLEVEAGSGRVSRPAADVAPDLTYDDEGSGVVRADWLGRWPIVYGRRPGHAGDRADWFQLAPAGAVNLTAHLPAAPPTISAVDGTSLILVADGRAWRVGADGRARRLMGAVGLRNVSTAHFGRGVRFEVNAPPRQAWTWVADAREVLRIGGPQRPMRIALADGEAPGAFGEAQAALRRRDARGVQAVTVVGRSGPATVLTVNPALAEVDAMPVEAIEHPGPDGRPLTSWLYRPPGLAPGARPPLIVLPYPGLVMPRPSGRYSPDALIFTPNARLLATHGFAVLAPSLPRDQAPGEPAAGLADQILAAVDAVVARGLADPDRLALWGHSFGGYAALVTATQTTRFKAVVAQAGPANLVAAWGTLPLHFRAVPQDGPAVNLSAGWAEGGQGGLGAAPWADPDRYRRNSPLYAADRIRTPLFLIQGDQDFVALSQEEAMFAALYRQGKDAVLMTLPGEGHLPASPANVRAIYDRLLPWLDRELGGLPVKAPPAVRANDEPRPRAQ